MLAGARWFPAFQCLVLCLLIAIALGELYSAVQLAWSIEQTWLAPALVNSILAAVVWVLLRHGYLPKPTPRLASAAWAWLPSVIILVVCLSLAIFSRLAFGGASSAAVDFEYVYFVLWIPLVEELLFRVGFGAFFRCQLGDLAGAYVSALLFALAHSMPTWSSLVAWQVGVPLGPLLLGLCNEALYLYSGRVTTIVALHAVCNFSVVIFTLLDDRWLHWLSWFYL